MTTLSKVFYFDYLNYNTIKVEIEGRIAIFNFTINTYFKIKEYYHFPIIQKHILIYQLICYLLDNGIKIS